MRYICIELSMAGATGLSFTITMVKIVSIYEIKNFKPFLVYKSQNIAESVILSTNARIRDVGKWRQWFYQYRAAIVKIMKDIGMFTNRKARSTDTIHVLY